MYLNVAQLLEVLAGEMRAEICFSVERPRRPRSAWLSAELARRGWASLAVTSSIASQVRERRMSA